MYRFFDLDDDLLYIGIAGNDHAKEKAWWPQVTRSTMEHFPSREAALAAERAAITEERPHGLIRLADARAPRTVRS